MSENPERGCGTKAPGGTYLEGPASSSEGVLRTWAWLLGDGYSQCIPLAVPPRQMIVINPAATITICALVKERFGPSRRIPKSMAKRLLEIVWSRGPIPMLFTHNRMPIFDSVEDVHTALYHAQTCLEIREDETEFFWWEPTWEHPDWSQYVTEFRGDNSVLVPILRLIDELENDWRNKKKLAPYQAAKDFFSGLRFVEQAFGASWMSKVTHCAKEDGTYDDEILEMQHFYGKQMVHTIDLAALEEEE
jgi:hypothetical protein